MSLKISDGLMTNLNVRGFVNERGEFIKIHEGKCPNHFIDNILMVLVALGLKPSARLSRQDAIEFLRKDALSRPSAL